MAPAASQIWGKGPNDESLDKARDRQLVERLVEEPIEPSRAVLDHLVAELNSPESSILLGPRQVGKTLKYLT